MTEISLGIFLGWDGMAQMAPVLSRLEFLMANPSLDS